MKDDFDIYNGGNTQTVVALVLIAIFVGQMDRSDTLWNFIIINARPLAAVAVLLYFLTTNMPRKNNKKPPHPE